MLKRVFLEDFQSDSLQPRVKYPNPDTEKPRPSAQQKRRSAHANGVGNILGHRHRRSAAAPVTGPQNITNAIRVSGAPFAERGGRGFSVLGLGYFTLG